jgi:hypothetical protein
MNDLLNDLAIAGAVANGVAKALVHFNPNFKDTLDTGNSIY